MFEQEDELREKLAFFQKFGIHSAYRGYLTLVYVVHVEIYFIVWFSKVDFFRPIYDFYTCFRH